MCFCLCAYASLSSCVKVCMCVVMYSHIIEICMYAGVSEICMYVCVWSCIHTLVRYA